jgi:hypothetical protein
MPFRPLTRLLLVARVRRSVRSVREVPAALREAEHPRRHCMQACCMHMRAQLCLQGQGDSAGVFVKVLLPIT